MKVNYNTFLLWVSERFSEYHESNGEIKINSMFAEDRKFHLWCNPEKNLFHCWKSNQGGSLTKLVTIVDKCNWKLARSILGLNKINLDEEIEEFMKLTYSNKLQSNLNCSVELPSHTFLISDLSDYSPMKRIATTYLENRLMPITGLYVCTEGEYSNRIIIPYRRANGDIYYWNGRDLTDNKNRSKYQGPKNVGIGKSDVLYFYSYPVIGSDIVLTEGEFDAISLNLSGLFGIACGGKELSYKQIEILKDYNVCLGLDNDESGKKATENIGFKLLSEGISCSFICPPVGFKDWNKLLVEKGKESVFNYIKNNQTSFNEITNFLSQLI